MPHTFKFCRSWRFYILSRQKFKLVLCLFLCYLSSPQLLYDLKHLIMKTSIIPVNKYIYFVLVVHIIKVVAEKNQITYNLYTYSVIFTHIGVVGTEISNDVTHVFWHICETQILIHCLHTNKISNCPSCDIVIPVYYQMPQGLRPWTAKLAHGWIR